MINNGPIMPTPGFMGDMGMAPMNFLPLGPMGQPHMMMGMDPMAMGSMAGCQPYDGHGYGNGRGRHGSYFSHGHATSPTSSQTAS